MTTTTARQDQARTHRSRLQIENESVYENALTGIDHERSVTIVKAPPGSGKTHLLSRLAQKLQADDLRVAVATQTIAQADDLCRRLSHDWNLRPYRFLAQGGAMQTPDRRIREITHVDEIPKGRCVVVGTSAKWGFVSNIPPFDVLLVDEAWQMQWCQFIPLGRVAGRFVLIGDPGQIPPVVSVDASRWETTDLPPHLPAPQVICSGNIALEEATLTELRLPASRRLPPDAVELLQPFYDFRFASWALPGERRVMCSGRDGDRIDHGLRLLADGSVIAMTVATPSVPPPSERDEEVASLAVSIARRLLERRTCVQILDEGEAKHRVAPEDIALTATHRMMNDLLLQYARRAGLSGVRVDTPERWQGLERMITIAIHPLSGVTRPSSFDLETGRLCVMASRHRAGLILVGRDHIGETLQRSSPPADQAIGRPDVSGRGQHQHLSLWSALRQQERIVATR